MRRLIAMTFTLFATAVLAQSSPDDVACVCARSFAHLPVHSEPMASLAVWLERGSKREAIDGAFDRRHTPRGKLRTGVLW